MRFDRKGKLIPLWFLVAYLSGFHAMGQSDKFVRIASDNDFAKHVQEFSQDLTSIQCDFTQLKKLEYLEVDLESAGKFWFQSPNKVRWEYRDPYQYIVLLNEGKLNLISESNENEIDMRSNIIFEEINTLIISAVSGDIFNNPQYSVESFENNNYYKIELKPKSSSVALMIEQMELYFDKNNYSVSKIKMIEPSSDFSLISFTNQHFNEPLPESIFNP